MATYPFPCPSAATYPPFFYHAPPAFPCPTPASACTPPPGGYYSSPFPFCYHDPPALPCPPPASAYTPPPGFFPASSHPKSIQNRPTTESRFHGESNLPSPQIIPPTSPQLSPPTMSKHSQERLEQAAEDAALRAAAQAQAQLEEELSGRLPREVLSIQKRLDRQQSSVDRLQINISSLTEMVAQIGVALGKQPAPSTGPNSPAPTSKPATATQSPASDSSEFYGALSLRSSLCGRPKLQQHKEGGSGGDLSVGTNTSGTSINGKKLVHKQPGLEILSMGHAGSTYHFSPAPSPVLDLDRSYDRQPEFQQGATSGSPALHVFDEMPTPGSGYENYCYGHPNPVRSSCMHGGSTNLTEQHIDGMPQSYGFHNLNRQSIFLADGTEHSYFSLRAEYPLEHSTPRMPSSATATNVSEKMPVYDVYEEDATACWSCIYPTVDITEAVTEQVEVKADSGKPICSPERPSIGVFRLKNEKKPDNGWTSMCVNKMSDNAFSVEATEFAFAHDHVIHADMSIKIKNEKSTQAASMSVQGATVHCADEISEINFKKQDVLIDKHDMSDSKPDVSFLKSDISPHQHPCNLSNDKEELFWNLESVRSTTGCSISVLKFGVREAYPILPCIWDPGIDRFSYKKLHLLCWHQDIKFNGIALWLITFNPP